MARDHRKLKVFGMADSLCVDVYQATRIFPPEERYGLQSQLRRAAFSTPTNIVEGAARGTSREFAQFLRISLGSASEVRYLIDLSRRLEYLPDTPFCSDLARKSDELVKALNALVEVVSREGAEN